MVRNYAILSDSPRSAAPFVVDVLELSELDAGQALGNRCHDSRTLGLVGTVTGLMGRWTAVSNRRLSDMNRGRFVLLRPRRVGSTAVVSAAGGAGGVPKAR